MPDFETFPEPYRPTIRTVARLLNTDYTTAYFAILLESIMTDLDPADPAISESIARYEAI